MADRHATSSRIQSPGVSKARSGIASTSHNVRRNLFQSQITRRPPAGSSMPSGELHLDDDVHEEHHHHSQFQSQPETAFPQDDDIVVRNDNGEIEMGDPPTPTIGDPEDLEAQHENELERQRLADAVKQHRIDQHSVPSQPEELLEAVKASLRAKVAALGDDNWLYEPELPQRHQ
ncbi:hypothetical protein N657DRAFT_641620 [Parathielavia appendiculata]|uniref:Uncharacterized protein n=1 Tax=Parathielavia appendiculata TaxID=2587402 RepID=A0AAN6Z7Y9_9PEZI|nr:hypothetical protein N657DRAFT_641620 [Parathielavia appendiculata]